MDTFFDELRELLDNPGVVPEAKDVPGGYVSVREEYSTRRCPALRKWWDQRTLRLPDPHPDDLVPSHGDKANIWGVHWAFSDRLDDPDMTWYATDALHQGTVYRRALEVLDLADPGQTHVHLQLGPHVDGNHPDSIEILDEIRGTLAMVRDELREWQAAYRRIVHRRASLHRHR